MHYGMMVALCTSTGLTPCRIESFHGYHGGFVSDVCGTQGAAIWKEWHRSAKRWETCLVPFRLEENELSCSSAPGFGRVDVFFKMVDNFLRDHYYGLGSPNVAARRWRLILRRARHTVPGGCFLGWLWVRGLACIEGDRHLDHAVDVMGFGANAEARWEGSGTSV